MRVYNSVGKINAREAARDAQASAAAFGVMPRRIAAAVAAEFDALTDRGELVAANFAITQAGALWAKQVAERRVLDFVDDAAEIIGRAGIAHTDLVALARAGEGAISGVLVGLEEDQAGELADMVAAEVGAKYPQSATDKGKAARATDSVYWRRQLSNLHGRALEQANREAGRVSRKHWLYCSDETVLNRLSQVKRNRALLETLKAINEAEQEYTLQQLADLGMSNPKNRKGELMVRIRGFEEIARGCGHAGEFYTLTTPSQFHAVGWDGKPNPKYNGATPKQAQAYLCRVWAKIRSALSRRRISIYGFRVAEPHHDGTPHWHMLMFMDQEHVGTVREIMRKYALELDGEEKGADKRRFTAVAIDWARGSAAGYIAKYICKNVDGRTAGEDQTGLVDMDLEAETGATLADTAARVDAWAACWGIRQFQQIGGAPVSIWRELRRLDVETLGGNVAEIAAAADQADWARFCGLMAKVSANVVRNEAGPGRYGEPVFKPVGVSIDGAEIVTRFQEWFIGRERDVAEEKERRGMAAALAVVRGAGRENNKANGLGGVGADYSGSVATFQGFAGRGAVSKGIPGDPVLAGNRFCGIGLGFGQAEGAAAWTGVNNCTPPDSWAALFEDVESFLVGVGDDKNGKIDRFGGSGEQQEPADGSGTNQAGRWPEC